MLGPIADTRYSIPAEGKKKPIRVAKSFSVPSRPGRSGTKAPAAFLVDNAKYVFGLPTKGNSFSEGDGREKSGWFRELVSRCAEETKDEAAVAVASFLVAVAERRTLVTLPDDCRSNDLIAFRYSPDSDKLVHERPRVREYWKACRQSSPTTESARLRCLVTDKPIQKPGLFPKIKGIPGARPAEIGLVCFDDRSFESYGWDRNENAPISGEAADACARALTRLLHPAYPIKEGQTLERRSVRLSSDTAVCYWTKEPSGDMFCSAFGGFAEGSIQDVPELYRSIWRGKEPNIEDTSAFYALTLSGTQGRAIVRDWFESTVDKVARNLAEYFGDLAIVLDSPSKNEDPRPFSITHLLQSLAAQGKDDNIPAPYVSQIVKSALHGTPFPFAFLQRAVERARAEIGKQGEDGLEGYKAKTRADARAALIKAVLNRRKRFSQTTNYQEVTPDMDPTNSSEGYILGRLMAVLERIQQEAIGDVNASVVDRYFSGASANPKTVFVRLLKNARHHVSNARDDDKRGGLVFLLDKLIDELATRFDPKHNGFPAYLDLEQQGLFVLGYHQMRKWLWMSKEERAEWEQHHLDAPKAYLWSKAN